MREECPYFSPSLDYVTRRAARRVHAFATAVSERKIVTWRKGLMEINKGYQILVYNKKLQLTYFNIEMKQVRMSKLFDETGKC
ncbi:hypothetical protein [Shinella sp.]|uniref:hypothetical protein n=1 Tax=Shinella sp. TaxID=1870904 RepID=UPI00301C84B6